MRVGVKRNSHKALGAASAFGLMHLVVDASCIALLVWGKAASLFPDDVLWGHFFFYNTLAFGTQFSMGAAADCWKAYRATLFIGLAMVAAAMVVALHWPLAAVVLAALGNAAFHVGAGAIVLTHWPTRAAAAGVFVGPGAVGVAIGLSCGGAFALAPWLFLGTLVVCALAVFVLPNASESGKEHLPPPFSPGKLLAMACVGAIVLVVGIRSLSGQSVAAIHDGQTGILWGLAIASCAGNILGGFVSDHQGWIRTCVVAILLSLPFVSFLVDYGTAAIVGMVLFQMTMPVTLLAIRRLLPGEAGFAFGITALAVLAGVMPFYAFPPEWLTFRPLLLCLSLISIAAIIAGLWPIVRREKTANGSPS